MTCNKDFYDDRDDPLACYDDPLTCAHISFAQTPTQYHWCAREPHSTDSLTLFFTVVRYWA
jgi:hypothetical protein